MNALLVTLTTRKWPQASKWNSSGPGSICRSCHELGLTSRVCEYGQAIVAIPLLGNFNYNRLHRLVWVILWHITSDDSFKADWRTFSLAPKWNLKSKLDLLIPTLKRLPASTRLWSGEIIIVQTFSFSPCRKIILVIPLKLVKCHFCVLKRSSWVCLQQRGEHGPNLAEVTIIHFNFFVCGKNQFIVDLKLPVPAVVCIQVLMARPF